MTSTPATLARIAAERRAAAERHYQDARRRDARSNGYHGPLTRAELAASSGRPENPRRPRTR